jgi:hypothetical protein
MDCEHTYIILDDLPGQRLIICKLCGFVPNQDHESTSLENEFSLWEAASAHDEMTLTANVSGYSGSDIIYRVWNTTDEDEAWKHL